MKKIPHQILFFLFIYGVPCHAQELVKTGEKYIADLASVEMEGRGYVNNGMAKAANYMATAFQRLGLKPLSNSYLQPYSHSVNTFPDSMRVEINGIRLVPGKDFIMDAASGGEMGNYAAELLNEKTIWKFTPNGKTAVVFQSQREIKNSDSSNAIIFLLHSIAKYQPVIEITRQKLTWSVCANATDTLSHAYIQVLQTAVTQTPVWISLHIKQLFIPTFEASNVCAVLPATKKSKKYIVFSAHYDHLGKMGSDATFRGANDNAGGCAMLLCMAQALAQQTNRNVNYVFIGFGSEEAGLIGSYWFAEHPLIKLKQIKFLLNLDLVATGEAGITVVNGIEFKEQFALLQKINNANDYFQTVKRRGAAANSDHYPFYLKGVPSFFIYTMGGSQAYHDIYDVPDNLHLEGFHKLINLMLNFCAELK